MKILTVVYNLEKGGTQRAAQVFAEAYQKLGHDSRVLSLYGLGYRYDEIKNILNVWDQLSSENLLEIKKWNPDILHIHSHGPRKEDIDNLINGLTSVKVIETNVFSTPSAWANKVDISFQLSSWAQWIFNLRGGRQFKSQIVPNPVKCSSFQKSKKNDISKFKETYKIPEDSFVIGRIGQSFPGKWSPMLLEVFNDLAKKQDNIYLMIVNAPECILEIVEKSPYKNRIIHIPTIMGDKNLSIAYSSMDVMVLIAEQGESFGMVLAEAILCETPVVTLSTPWADNSQCEVVANQLGGYIANSADGIKKAINLLYEKKDTLIKGKGIKHIHEEYNYIRVAQKALDSLSTRSNIVTSQSVLNILKNTIDKPNFLTILFLKFNNDIFRKLTIYTSNYKSWNELGFKILKKFKVNKITQSKDIL